MVHRHGGFRSVCGANERKWSMSDSQKMQVLNYMKTHRGITQEEAVEHFKCYRLASRIKDLRDDGVKIVTYMEDNKNRRGQHARYFIDMEGA